MDFESFARRVKGDVFGSIVVAASMLGLIFSIVRIDLDRFGFDVYMSQLSGVKQLFYGLESIFRYGIDSFLELLAIPVSLLFSLLVIAVQFAPFVLLPASLVVKKKSTKRALIAIALVLLGVEYLLWSAAVGSGLPMCIVVSCVMPPIAFLLCMFVLRDVRHASLLLAAALCAGALICLIAGIEPYGYACNDGDHSYNIGTFLRSVATWLSCAFAIASANGAGSTLFQGICVPCGASRAAARPDGSLLPALDKIKELKRLLDDAVITQEEFDEMKKKLLKRR